MRDKVTLEIEPIENGFLVTVNEEEIVAIGSAVGRATKVDKYTCPDLEGVLQRVFCAIGPGGMWSDFVKNHLNPNEENPE